MFAYFRVLLAVKASLPPTAVAHSTDDAAGGRGGGGASDGDNGSGSWARVLSGVREFLIEDFDEAEKQMTVRAGSSLNPKDYLSLDWFLLAADVANPAVSFSNCEH